MPIGGIVMGPVDQTALRVPDVFSKERDRIAFLQVFYPRCKLDVVLNQNCLARWQANDEALMRRTLFVVREDPCDNAFALDLNISSAFFKCAVDRRPAISGTAKIITADHQTDSDERDGNE